ncbi:acyl-CoA synthetase (AMP-forming)/AMP-acid ligase II [Thermocatellispora tengchongensis]|uniref:Acyl-CoA synthetase (AMP-forming)/AMP-acid ligase II n=2 Tax=Thermocatellispora tengchongensis TaxID=1073253 RepID=A0A840PFL9_9ACTN|nr:class I adenylate-forming enzyme family protein [Thermocatellispora tengchongensis]MBB5136743.1 acyl-CoA synthetase (AMP-forming)/AMP-acid ligase II [Thermocatellispora tengchongensis]
MIPRTVPGMLALRAAQEPERIAIVVAGEGELTFAQWERRSHAAAHGLLDRGVRPGDRIGLLFEGRDWIDFAVAYCAVQLAGAVAVPVPARLAPAEVQRLLGHCGACAVVHGRGLRVPDGGERWTAAPADLEGRETRPVDARVGPDDLAQILYTSGTTGTPKGVGATHANLTFGCETRPNRRRFRHSRYLLHAFPIGTNAGQTMLINALDAHPAMLTPPRFTPARFARLIAAYAAGTVFVVPAMAIEFLNSGMHERYDMSSVVLLGSAASALPPSVSARLAAAFPNATVINYYTSTEAAPAQTIMVYDPARPGALGRPAFGGALRVTGPDGEVLPPREVGEVWMRSPAAPRSYYRDEGANAEAFRDGWVRMGDLGYLDADGHLHLVDREGDVVKSGAFKVSTIQVEAALYEHPQVAEAAVLGVPHPVLGTVLAAVVVPRSAGVSGVELRAFLMDRVAAHELPERVLIVDALPRNQSGKVIKTVLRRLLETATTGNPEGT